MSDTLRLQNLKASHFRVKTGQDLKVDTPRLLRWRRFFNSRQLCSDDLRYVVVVGKRMRVTYRPTPAQAHLVGFASSREQAEELVAEHRRRMNTHNRYATKALIG